MRRVTNIKKPGNYLQLDDLPSMHRLHCFAEFNKVLHRTTPRRIWLRVQAYITCKLANTKIPDNLGHLFVRKLHAQKFCFLKVYNISTEHG